MFKRWMIVGLLAVGLPVWASGGKLASQPVVEMTTSMGVIQITLDADKAPVTVKNFLNYAKKGFYDNTIFHRVIPNFVIQGGGFNPNMTQKATDPAIQNEADNGLKNTKGTIAMARTQVVDSATSQFFINLRNNSNLNHQNKTTAGYGYCVFGKVTAGMDIVDKIAEVPTDMVAQYRNVPIKPVVIQSVKVL